MPFIHIGIISMVELHFSLCLVGGDVDVQKELPEGSLREIISFCLAEQAIYVCHYLYRQLADMLFAHVQVEFRTVLRGMYL